MFGVCHKRKKNSCYIILELIVVPSCNRSSPLAKYIFLHLVRHQKVTLTPPRPSRYMIAVSRCRRLTPLARLYGDTDSSVPPQGAPCCLPYPSNAATSTRAIVKVNLSGRRPRRPPELPAHSQRSDKRASANGGL